MLKQQDEMLKANIQTSWSLLEQKEDSKSDAYNSTLKEGIWIDGRWNLEEKEKERTDK